MATYSSDGLPRPPELQGGEDYRPHCPAYRCAPGETIPPAAQALGSGSEDGGRALGNRTGGRGPVLREKEMVTHFSVLAWRIPGMGEPGGLLSMELHRVGHD